MPGRSGERVSYTRIYSSGNGESPFAFYAVFAQGNEIIWYRAKQSILMYSSIQLM